MLSVRSVFQMDAVIKSPVVRVVGSVKAIYGFQLRNLRTGSCSSFLTILCQALGKDTGRGCPPFSILKQEKQKNSGSSGSTHSAPLQAGHPATQRFSSI